MKIDYLFFLLIFLIFCFFFSIQDIYNREITNNLIFLSLVSKIILNLIFYNKILTNNEISLINVILFILLYYCWKKELLGGGDVKTLLIFLIYIPDNSQVSIISIPNIAINDRFEFFFFLTLFLLLKIFFFQNLKKKSRLLYSEREFVILIPYFFFSSILMSLL